MASSLLIPDQPRAGRARTLAFYAVARPELALPLWNQAQENLRERLGEERWAMVNDGLTMLAKAAEGDSMIRLHIR